MNILPMMVGGDPPWYFASPYASAFNQPITSYTVAPGSEQAVATLATQCATAPALYVKQFGVIAKVPPGTPLVTMTGTNNFSPTNQIPLGGSFGTTIATLLGELASSDSPLFLYSPTANPPTDWEVWEATPPGATWTCGDGAQVSNMSTSNGALPNPYGENAAGLAYLATIITEGDMVFAAQNGYFPHTIAMIVSNETIKFWPPAVRNDGGAGYLAQTPALGNWFIMPSSVAMPGGLCTFAQCVFRTWQKFGLILTDRTGGFGCSVPCEYTPDWVAFGGPNPDPINIAFQGQSTSTMLNTLPVGSLVQIIPPVQGNPPGVIPAGPTSLTATAAAGAVNLSWTTSANVGNVYQTQIAYRITGSGPNNWTLLSPAPTSGATTATVFGLTPGTGYDFQAWDQNPFGMAPSNIATATPSAAAFTLVQSRSIASATSLAFSSPVVAGHLLLVHYVSTTSITGTSDTVNGASSYTKVAEEDDGTSVFMSSWVHPNTGGGTPTVSMVGGAAGNIIIEEWSGLATAAPIDQINGNQNLVGGTAITAGPLATLSAAGEPVFGVCWANNDSVVKGAGFNQDPNSLLTGGNGFLVEYVAAAATTGQSMSASCADSVWLATVFALKL